MKGKAISSSPDPTKDEPLPPRVRLPQPIRDLGPVDIAALLKQVSVLSELAWTREDEAKENKFEVFGHTQHMVFRFSEDSRDPRRFHDNPAWHIWRPVLMPVIEQAIAPYGFRQPVFPKAMLARLAARGVIDRHVDSAQTNLRTHKIHVPLVTNPGVTMSLGDSEHHLALGRAYEVNNVIFHGVRNDGETDRIHFIFEVFDAAAAA
jgi:Aspartyl/Asparaginyl beta-hydroxylase